MSKVQVKSFSEAQELLSIGDEIDIELVFDVTTDEFFTLAKEWCCEGVKIKKGDKFFIVSRKNFFIPAMS